MRYLVKFIKFMVVILAVLLAMELFIRLAEIESPSFNDYSATVGRQRIPESEYALFNEGFSLGQFNEGGYLGPYYPESKPDTCVRIALLGDSYVEGFQVFDRSHFRKIMESHLNNADSVQVLNFGRSGFNLLDMVAYDRKLVSQYDPDLKLYFVSRYDFDSIQSDRLIPRVYFDGDSILVSTPDSLSSEVKSYQRTAFLIQHSSLLQMMNKCRKLVKSGALWSKFLGKFYVTKAEKKQQINENQLLSNQAKRVLMIMAHQQNTILVNRDDDPLPQNMVSFIKQHNIPYIDLSPGLKQLYREGINPHYWKATSKVGHWNHAGHQLVGKILADSLGQYIDKIH